jgi:hypothetical protein
MIYPLILSILANLAIPIVLTYLHQKEKRDLHNRLMAKSPDEYIYDTQVAPAEAQALRQEFLAEKMEKPELTPADKRRTIAGKAY